jgi:hypothetical protein
MKIKVKKTKLSMRKKLKEKRRNKKVKKNCFKRFFPYLVLLLRPIPGPKGERKRRR